MADLIKIKGGNGDVPTLQDRELAINKNGKESELYCGIGDENVRLCGAKDKALLDTLYETVVILQATIEDITARLDNLETPSE